MRIRLAPPKTVRQSLSYVSIGCITIVSIAFIDYSLGTYNELSIWRIASGLVLGVAVLAVLYGLMMAARASRQLPTYGTLEVVRPSPIDFSSLHRATIKKVTENRLVFGVAIILVFGFIGFLLFTQETTNVFSENMPLAIGVMALAVAVGVYMIATYFIYRDKNDPQGNVLERFAGKNGFQLTGDTIRSEIATMLEYTPYYPASRLIKTLTVYESITGEYRGVRLSLAACMAQDSVGVILLTFNTPFVVPYFDRFQETIQSTDDSFMHVIAEGNCVLITINQGLFIDELAMRHYFNAIDAIIDTQETGV